MLSPIKDGHLASTMACSSMVLDGGNSQFSNLNQIQKSVSIQKVYCPPVKVYDLPSSNPFYNGNLAVNPVRPVAKTQTRNTKIDVGAMSRKQQLKSQNLLLQRSKYLELIKKRNFKEDKNDFKSQQQQQLQEMQDLSYDDLVRMREKLKLGQTEDDQKDHLFRNKYVYD